MPIPLFNQVLGVSFADLPVPLQSLHNGHSKRWCGTCDVERGTSLLSRIVASITSLPPAGSAQPIEVTIECHEDGETWVRQFDNHRMRSRLAAQGTILVEQLGP